MRANANLSFILTLVMLFVGYTSDEPLIPERLYMSMEDEINKKQGKVKKNT